MEREFVATTKSGIEVKFNSEISESGYLTSDYPVEMAHQNRTMMGYSIVLSPKKVSELFNIKVNKKAHVILNNNDAWASWQKEAEKIRVAYEKKEAELELTDLIKNNSKLHLEIGFTSFGKLVVGLPKGLKNKEDAVLKLDFNLDPYNGDHGKFFLDIPINKLLEKITEIEKTVKEKREKKAADNKKHKEIKLQEAVEKNEKVELYCYSDSCNDSKEECEIDNIVTYIYPDGKTKTIRHHTW